MMQIWPNLAPVGIGKLKSGTSLITILYMPTCLVRNLLFNKRFNKKYKISLPFEGRI